MACCETGVLDECSGGPTHHFTESLMALLHFGNLISGLNNVPQFCIDHQATLSACSHWQNATTRRSQTVCNSCFKRRNGISKAPTYHHGRSWYVIKSQSIGGYEQSLRNPAHAFNLHLGSYCCPATNYKARIELQTLGRDKDQLNKMNTSDSSAKDRKKAMLTILYNTEHCEKKCRIETH